MISANLSQADLTNASLYYCNLGSANMTDAVVQGADFGSTTLQGFTAAQLYSTASYKAKTLGGIRMDVNDLTGWNFAGQNLAGSSFFSATLNNTNFSGADLSGASFYTASLANANFTDATVQGAFFCSTTSKGFTPAMLYSTASYKAGNLQGTCLNYNDLTGWNFSGQNLSGAGMHDSTLKKANFSMATPYRRRLQFLHDVQGKLQPNRSDGRIAFFGHTEQRQLQPGESLRRKLSSATLTGANFSQSDLNQRELFFLHHDQRDYCRRLGARCEFLQYYLSWIHRCAALFHGKLCPEESHRNQSKRQRPEQLEFCKPKPYRGKSEFNLARKCESGGVQVQGANLSNSTTLGGGIIIINPGGVITVTNPTHGGLTWWQTLLHSKLSGGNLAGIDLSQNDLSGWSFYSKNLSGANFGNSNLSNASFYRSNLSGANLGGASLSGTVPVPDESVRRELVLGVAQKRLSDQANLTNASLYYANLSGADMTDAIVQGANFMSTTNFTAAAAYIPQPVIRRKIWRRIGMDSKDLSGWNFSGQNLSGADFWALFW